MESWLCLYIAEKNNTAYFMPRNAFISHLSLVSPCSLINHTREEEMSLKEPNKNSIRRYSDKRFRRKVSSTVIDYGLISQDDLIVAAISGGIDSLVMLENLAYIKRKSPIPFSIIATYVYVNNIDLEDPSTEIARFCKKIEIPFQRIEISVADNKNEKEKGMCFLCSWHRRKRLFQFANEHHANKIAFGHHLDDLLETLLMNMTFHGEYSTMPPLMQMNKADYSLIRPLSKVCKEEILKFAEHANIHAVDKFCPYEKENRRSTFRDIVNQISSQNHLAKINMFNAMTNINSEYLPQKIDCKTSAEE